MSTRKGLLIGIQASYQNLMEKREIFVSKPIIGNADTDYSKDVLNFDEGENVILIAGTFKECIGILYII